LYKVPKVFLFIAVLCSLPQVIVELNVANNGIDEFGCFTLMAGVRENASLRNLVLDGNPLGVQVRTPRDMSDRFLLYTVSPNASFSRDRGCNEKRGLPPCGAPAYVLLLN
jgi:hypothetical protein